MLVHRRPRPLGHRQHQTRNNSMCTFFSFIHIIIQNSCLRLSLFRWLATTADGPSRRSRDSKPALFASTCILFSPTLVYIMPPSLTTSHSPPPRAHSSIAWCTPHSHPSRLHSRVVVVRLIGSPAMFFLGRDSKTHKVKTSMAPTNVHVHRHQHIQGRARA